MVFLDDQSGCLKHPLPFSFPSLPFLTSSLFALLDLIVRLIQLRFAGSYVFMLRIIFTVIITA